MFGINKNGLKQKIGVLMPSFFPASRTSYDNTGSGLTSTNAQDAIDELAQGAGSDGHTIEDSAGTSMTQRAGLQFVGATVTDDSVDDRTVVTIPQGTTYTEGDGIDISAQDVISVDTTFTEASTRANIASGDTFATILGKIKKFFTDLKTVAFTGAYSDLSGTPTIPTKTSQLTNDSGYVTTDHTYNFNGDTFWSGDSNDGEHNANNAIKNGHYYYNSNGPATSLGMTTTDGALYVAQHSDNWIGQIAQDYRNGSLCVRGKNNGTWQAWKRVIDSGNIGSQSVNYATSAGSATTASRLAFYQNNYLVTARTSWQTFTLTASSNIVSAMICPAGRQGGTPHFWIEFSGKVATIHYKNDTDWSADGYAIWLMF